jgi:hypothetical protein
LPCRTHLTSFYFLTPDAGVHLSLTSDHHTLLRHDASP